VFSELPSIFDRNFVISFFLPALIFVIANLGFSYSLGVSLQAPPDSRLEATTLIAVASLLGGIILLVLNYEIYRILEGYPLESLAFLKTLELRRFRRMKRELEGLHAERKLYPAGTQLPSSLARRPTLWIDFVRRFPDKEDLVLPTSFGNTIRAFEVYSRVIYGFDAIPGWQRLQAVIPKDYSNLVNETKAIADFWVNLLLVSCLFAVEYIVIVLYTDKPVRVWVPGLSIVIAVVAYSRAKDAVRQWGEMVKGAFDVFLPDLRKKLEFPFPAGMQAERDLWTKFSRVMIFERSELELTRERTETPKPDVARSNVAND